MVNAMPIKRWKIMATFLFGHHVTRTKINESLLTFTAKKAYFYFYIVRYWN